jgi:hypothetical protein
MVSVAVPGFEPHRVTGEPDPKLRVGGYCAPAGLAVMAAVRATVPTKPLVGVTVTVEEFPLVAPFDKERFVAAIPKLALAGMVTDTTVVPVAAE